MNPPTSWVALVSEAFPQWQSFPPDCAVPLGISVNQWDFGPAIDAVTDAGQRAAFIRRLRLTHPPGRPHKRQFDDRFWNAFVEAEALAWAVEVAHLIAPTFVEREGAPDLAVEGGWIEAKTIEESVEEREESDRLYQRGDEIIFRGPRAVVSPDQALIRKFDRQQEDAIRKLGRQTGGSFATFFDLRTIDFGISRDEALRQVAEWAERRAHDDGTQIVVCFNHSWREPFVTAGSWTK